MGYRQIFICDVCGVEKPHDSNIYVVQLGCRVIDCCATCIGDGASKALAPATHSTGKVAGKKSAELPGFPIPPPSGREVLPSETKRRNAQKHFRTKGNGTSLCGHAAALLTTDKYEVDCDVCKRTIQMHNLESYDWPVATD